MVVTMGMMMMAVVDPSMADLLFEWCWQAVRRTPLAGDVPAKGLGWCVPPR